MYIVIFRINVTEIHKIGDHLLHDSSKVMINDILLTDILRVEIKSDTGGLLHVINAPKSDGDVLAKFDFSYGQEIDFNLLKQLSTAQKEQLWQAK
ncbi:hypothetical protein ACWAS0_004202 [Klebsiella pneumoniae]